MRPTPRSILIAGASGCLLAALALAVEARLIPDSASRVVRGVVSTHAGLALTLLALLLMYASAKVADRQAGAQPSEGEEEPRGQQSTNAKVLANTALVAGMGRASAAMDRLSVWMFAGVGAALGLFFVNLDTVLVYLDREQASSSAMLFAWSLIATIGQRWAALVVFAVSSGAEEGLNAFAKLGIAPSNFDLDTFLDEVAMAMWPPLRWIIRRNNRRLKSGDLVRAGRLAAKTTFVQGVFALAQILLVSFGVYSLAAALAS